MSHLSSAFQVSGFLNGWSTLFSLFIRSILTIYGDYLWLSIRLEWFIVLQQSQGSCFGLIFPLFKYKEHIFNCHASKQHKLLWMSWMQYIFRLSAIRSGQWWLTMEKRLEWEQELLLCILWSEFVFFLFRWTNEQNMIFKMSRIPHAQLEYVLHSNSWYFVVKHS